MSTTVLDVQGLSCSGCVSTVTRLLHEVDSGASIDVDLVKGGNSRVSVQSGASHQELRARLVAAGYRVGETNNEH